MSKVNGIKSRMDTLESISKLDKRRTFTDFYLTFDLDDYELFGKIRAMLNGELEPNNPAFMEFLDRCLEVYKVNTYDYSGITEDMMMDEVGKFKYRNGFIPKSELLGRAITFTPSLLPRATKLKSEYTNDVYDALKHDLVTKVRDEHSMVRNIAAYQELQRRIMRFQVGNGNRILKLDEVSELSDVSIDILTNPAIACRNIYKYLDVYRRLVLTTPAYDVRLSNK